MNIGEKVSRFAKLVVLPKSLRCHLGLHRELHLPDLEKALCWVVCERCGILIRKHWPDRDFSIGERKSNV